jgi:hypothetical protein
MSKRVAPARERIVKLEHVPNVGPRIAADFRKLGHPHPHSLAGADPYELYERLNIVTGVRQDPCVLDTFIAAVRYMEGAPKRPWWHYTAERKRTMSKMSARAVVHPAR